jgi:RNA polymerase sigma-70 factor (ECF subfamily)
MLANDADAEDVLGDVLLQVVRKLSTFRGDSALSTWLHKVTVNAALAHRGKQSRRPEFNLEDSLDDLPGSTSGAAEKGPGEVVLDRETQELIGEAIAGLPEMYRDVYVLADVEGLPKVEIASLLGMGVPALKSRLRRARLMLRDALAPHFPGGCCD